MESIGPGNLDSFGGDEESEKEEIEQRQTMHGAVKGADGRWRQARVEAVDLTTGSAR